MWAVGPPGSRILRFGRSFDWTKVFVFQNAFFLCDFVCWSPSMCQDFGDALFWSKFPSLKLRAKTLWTRPFDAPKRNESSSKHQLSGSQGGGWNQSLFSFTPIIGVSWSNLTKTVLCFFCWESRQSANLLVVFSLVVEFVRGKFVVMPAWNQGSDCKDSPSNSLLVGGFSPPRLKNMRGLEKLLAYKIKSKQLYLVYLHGFVSHSIRYYCWWLKFCITWDVQNPVNNGINY